MAFRAITGDHVREIGKTLLTGLPVMWIVFFLGLGPTTSTRWEARRTGLDLNWDTEYTYGGNYETWVKIKVTEFTVKDLQVAVVFEDAIDSSSLDRDGACPLVRIGGESNTRFVYMDTSDCKWLSEDRILLNFVAKGHNRPDTVMVAGMSLMGPILVRAGDRRSDFFKWSLVILVVLALLLASRWLVTSSAPVAITAQRYNKHFHHRGTKIDPGDSDRSECRDVDGNSS